MHETTSVRQAARRYLAQFLGSMAMYTVAVLGSTMWLRANPAAPIRWAVALIPLGAILVAVAALARHYLRQDEFLRRKQVDSLALAFVGTALAVVTYGFLESAGFPRLSVWWVWTVMGLLWGLGSVIAAFRYR